MKIGIDAMGGDYAPVEIVKGAALASKDMDLELVLFGKEEQIRSILAKCSYDEKRITIVNSSEIIENEDDPIRAVRRKKDSSLVRGLDALSEKQIDALVCAGNTGAIIAGSVFKLGRLSGVSRPSLTPIIPTDHGFAAILDAGANAECTPENLYEFAVMGSFYIEKVYDIHRPRVGLVNIGAEEHKGTPLTRQSYQLLKESNLNFIGNLEARDIPAGAADVIVTDGFTGNVILKLTEGLGIIFSKYVKELFIKNTLTKCAALLVKKGLLAFKKKLDYKEYGGAPLLGIDGVVIKAHGSSDSKAIHSAIRQAEKFVTSDVLSSIRKYLTNQERRNAKNE